MCISLFLLRQHNINIRSFPLNMFRKLFLKIGLIFRKLFLSFQSKAICFEGFRENSPGWTKFQLKRITYRTSTVDNQRPPTDLWGQLEAS